MQRDKKEGSDLVVNDLRQSNDSSERRMVLVKVDALIAITKSQPARYQGQPAKLRRSQLGKTAPEHVPLVRIAAECGKIEGREGESNDCTDGIFLRIETLFPALRLLLLQSPVSSKVILNKGCVLALVFTLMFFVHILMIYFLCCILIFEKSD